MGLWDEDDPGELRRAAARGDVYALTKLKERQEAAEKQKALEERTRQPKPPISPSGRKVGKARKHPPKMWVKGNSATNRENVLSLLQQFVGQGDDPESQRKLKAMRATLTKETENPTVLIGTEDKFQPTHKPAKPIPVPRNPVIIKQAEANVTTRHVAKLHRGKDNNDNELNKLLLEIQKGNAGAMTTLLLKVQKGQVGALEVLRQLAENGHEVAQIALLQLSKSRT